MGSTRNVRKCRCFLGQQQYRLSVTKKRLTALPSGLVDTFTLWIDNSNSHNFFATPVTPRPECWNSQQKWRRCSQRNTVETNHTTGTENFSSCFWTETEYYYTKHWNPFDRVSWKSSGLANNEWSNPNWRDKEIVPCRRPVRSDEQTWSRNIFFDVRTGGDGDGKNWPTAEGQASSKPCFKSGQRTVDALTRGTTQSTTKHHRPSVDKSASHHPNSEMVTTQCISRTTLRVY